MYSVNGTCQCVTKREFDFELFVMALPTLRHYYVPLRDRNSARVQKMANRTMLENERRKQWTENTRYFKNAEVNSRKTEVWTSQDCFKNRYIYI